MEENIKLHKELSLLTEEYKCTKERAKKLKEEKEKLKNLYVFFHNDQKMKAKNCEKCEKTRYEITDLCNEAPRIIKIIKEMESRRRNLKEKVFDSYPKRLKALDKEKQRMHKDALYHLAFVEEDLAHKSILKEYLMEEVKEKELKKVKSERKMARRVKRLYGIWDRKNDPWYNSDTDSDAEIVTRKLLKKREEEDYFGLLEEDRWDQYRYQFSHEAKQAAIKFQYDHQTVSDEENNIDMLQDIGHLDCASEIKAKFAAGSTAEK